MNIDNFTLEQKHTYTCIVNLKKKLEEAIDPSIFILNPKVQKIKNQIREIQDTCHHIYENDVCVICGRAK